MVSHYQIDLRYESTDSYKEHAITLQWKGALTLWSGFDSALGNRAIFQNDQILAPASGSAAEVGDGELPLVTPERQRCVTTELYHGSVVSLQVAIGRMHLDLLRPN